MNQKYSILALAILVISFFLFSVYSSENITVISAPQAMSAGDARAMHPQWSPNGHFLAFTGPNYQGLWVIDLARKTTTQLTNEIGAGYGFQWSHSGDQIVCRVSKYEDMERSSALKIFNIRDGSSRSITAYRRQLSGVPKWTITDDRVVIATENGIESLNTGEKQKTTSPKFNSMYSQSADSNGLLLSDVENGVSYSIKPIEGRYLNDVLSPDCKKVAFEIIGGHMYVCKLDGSDLRDLGLGYRPQWSPDSQWLIYMITEDDGHVFTKADIYAIKINGSHKTNLTEEFEPLAMNPSWSPNGKQIAYDSPEDGRIYIIDVQVK